MTIQPDAPGFTATLSTTVEVSILISLSRSRIRCSAVRSIDN